MTPDPRPVSHQHHHITCNRNTGQCQCQTVQNKVSVGDHQPATKAKSLSPLQEPRDPAASAMHGCGSEGASAKLVRTLGGVVSVVHVQPALRLMSQKGAYENVCVCACICALSEGERGRREDRASPHTPCGAWLGAGEGNTHVQKLHLLHRFE